MTLSILLSPFAPFIVHLARKHHNDPKALQYSYKSLRSTIKLPSYDIEFDKIENERDMNLLETLRSGMLLSKWLSLHFLHEISSDQQEKSDGI